MDVICDRTKELPYRFLLRRLKHSKYLKIPTNTTKIMPICALTKCIYSNLIGGRLSKWAALTEIVLN